MRYFTKSDITKMFESAPVKDLAKKIGLEPPVDFVEKSDPAELSRIFNRLSKLPLEMIVGGMAGMLSTFPKEQREAVLETWENNQLSGVTYEMLEQAMDEGIFSDMEDDSNEEG